MKAAALIALAASKGYGISRKRPNHYRFQKSDGASIQEQSFFGSWIQFCEFIKAL